MGRGGEERGGDGRGKGREGGRGGEGRGEEGRGEGREGGGKGGEGREELPFESMIDEFCCN